MFGTLERTIRLYITSGFLPQPLRACKHVAYVPAHLEAVERIRSLQAKGHSLAKIRRQTGAPKELRALPAPCG